jgi:hypothetical protein
LLSGVPDDDLACLIGRMIRVVEDPREWIGEHAECFFECDSVFLDVCFGFCGIPFKIHTHRIFGSLPHAASKYRPELPTVERAVDTLSAGRADENKLRVDVLPSDQRFAAAFSRNSLSNC